MRFLGALAGAVGDAVVEEEGESAEETLAALLDILPHKSRNVHRLVILY